jgi:hypothetical protein
MKVNQKLIDELEKENSVMTTNASQKAVGTKDQYSLAKILGIWAAATLPMAILRRLCYRCRRQ